MSSTVKPYWERTLHRLRLVLADDDMSEHRRAESQDRVMRDRDHRAVAPNASEGPATNYRAMMLDAQGRIVRSEIVAAAGDDAASALAAGMAEGHAVDLWDGLRFIEHFVPPRP